jgi:hypothetical protein
LLHVGQNLLLNNRRWHIRHIQPVTERLYEIEAIGASQAAMGMTRRMTVVCYGDDVFISQPHRLWHGHLQRDWQEDLYGSALHCQPAIPLELLNSHTQHPALGELKNEFTWSYSRANKYQFCARAYYYHYYAAWEGWSETAPEPVQRAYLLKNLTDIPRWLGTLVHESLKFALARLKAGQPVPPGDLLKQMRSRAQADFSDSQSGRYRQEPGQKTGFQEHYYQVQLPRSEWERAWQRAEQYLTTFLNSPLYAHLQQQPSQTFLDVETLQSFTWHGVKIWVQMDLARLEEERLYIYDWKTGHVEDEARLRQQLGIYALYFQQAHPEWVANRTLWGVVYDLAQDRLFEFELTESTLQETHTSIKKSVAQLQGLLLDREANLTELERFPMISALSVCRTCQFRELCGRDKV